MRKTVIFCVAALSVIMMQCQQSTENKSSINKPERPAAPKWQKPDTEVSYHFEPGKPWAKKKDSLDTRQLRILLAVNRVDADNISRLDSVLVPESFSGDIVYYLPFPLKVSYLEDVGKIIFFSYPTQSFGAYEYGNLVYAGPTNMGRKADPTPPGLYYTNWKAEKTTSTFDDEWELKWNFNVQNKEGIGWHQYALPGYPASHSCLRLLEEDAKHLYTWADEWKLKGRDSVLLKGTPVVVFGSYPFDEAKPWMALKDDAKALNISASMLEEQVKPHLNEILEQQEKRWRMMQDTASSVHE